MPLFEVTDPTAQLGYRNLRDAVPGSQGSWIKEGLERLWVVYEPYADGDFVGEFSRQPDTRFWEMYLSVRFLNTRRKKKMRLRGELAAAERDIGPDLCFTKGTRKIWIEAVAPDQGAPTNNLDRVPDLIPAGALEGEVHEHAPPLREVALRITSALHTKTQKFQAYRAQGIIGDNDSCIVAISGGQFPLQAVPVGGLPHAFKAVYPFGEEFFVLDDQGNIARQGHRYDAEIKRAGRDKKIGKEGDPIKRTAFQHEAFADISGLIWSRRSIGNFLNQPDDFVFVHNSAARKPMPRRWIDWAEEYFPIEQGTKIEVVKRRKVPRRLP